MINTDNIVYGECAKHPENNMVNCSECEMEKTQNIKLKQET